ncbi:toll/interleukin-1 receptor domain-containing protein [Flavobacteriaceae bacterium S0862]|nr:toll/interleukin-1 receptor domain-containing protein [Flavobacteriaceae bacterium S0862]
MKYNAFLSYSHAKDSDLAPSLERGLEKFAKPLFKRRALEIFRDANDLSASPDLWGKIEDGLNNSEYFIFLGSRKAAQSRWCRKEVEHWKLNKSIDKFLVVLTDGDLVWDESKNDFDWTKTTALPTNLSGAFNNEPLYVDFREGFTNDQLNLDNPKFKSNVVLLAATMHKKSIGDMVGEATKQHKKLIRIRNSVISVLVIFLTISIFLTFFAFNKKAEADEQKILAQRETKRALLGNYIASIQTEINEDPTKALRLAEYAYTFALKNDLPLDKAKKQLIKVFYSGNDFYLEHNITDDNLRKDRRIYDKRPTEFDCYEGRRVVADSNDVLYSTNRKYAIVRQSFSTATLIEPNLYKYCNYFFPSFRERKHYFNSRYPINKVTFIDRSKQILTESMYVPWNAEEHSPMGDGHEKYFYHLYDTEATAFVEDLGISLNEHQLREEIFHSQSLDTLNIEWPPKLKSYSRSSPVKKYNNDSTLYITNIGVFNNEDEQIIDLVMPWDDLSSNYEYQFSDDSNFIFINFRPFAPPIPELDRRWIFTLNPELIISKINNYSKFGTIEKLNEEDKKRFLINSSNESL